MLQKISTPKNVLDIGSGTYKGRTVIQPYIDENIFKPLSEKNSKITYLDLQTGTGIDIVADVTDKSFSISHKYDLVICTSLLEHVSDLKRTIFNISSTVRDGGYLIITMPLIFPYHADPIDNLCRFKPEELSNLFSVYSFKTIYDDVSRSKWSITDWSKLIVHSFIRVFLTKKYSALLFNLNQCLSREWKVSIVLLKRERKAKR